MKRTKFNVCLLGNGRVGKTSIVNVHSGKEFDPHILMTIGLDNCIEEVEFEGTKYKFKIFDTAGQEYYKSISTQSIKISDGFLIVFSVVDRTSYENIMYWINMIKDKANISKKVLILIGNKIDINERLVTNEEAMKFAKENNMKYFEVSAKTGFGIKDIFDTLYKDIYSKYKILEKSNPEDNEDNNKRDDKVISLDEKKHTTKENNQKGCC